MSHGLGAQPRIRLVNLPTPLQEAPRLREALGGADRCPKILLKRDDLTGLAFGGNKGASSNSWSPTRSLRRKLADHRRCGNPTTPA
ncbi:MAG: hypothetical protein U0841_04155 [Chloroflexia bacterium]